MYEGRVTDQTSTRLVDRIPMLARAIAGTAAVAAALAGVVWGTHVAGGPDSYCYLSQAELFASGHVSHSEPLAVLALWKDGAMPLFQLATFRRRALPAHPCRCARRDI